MGHLLLAHPAARWVAAPKSGASNTRRQNTPTRRKTEMDDEEKDYVELLDDAEYHVKRLVHEFEFQVLEVTSEARTQLALALQRLAQARMLIATRYTRDDLIVKAGHAAAVAYIERSNLEQDAHRYRKIVQHPHLALQYCHEGVWKDVEFDSSKLDDPDFLHKMHDPIVDSYDHSNR